MVFITSRVVGGMGPVEKFVQFAYEGASRLHDSAACTPAKS